MAEFVLAKVSGGGGESFPLISSRSLGGGIIRAKKKKKLYYRLFHRRAVWESSILRVASENPPDFHPPARRLRPSEGNFHIIIRVFLSEYFLYIYIFLRHKSACAIGRGCNRRHHVKLLYDGRALRCTRLVIYSGDLTL